MKKGIIFLGTILLITLITSLIIPMTEGLSNPGELTNPGECGPDSYCKYWQTPAVCQGTDLPCNVPAPPVLVKPTPPTPTPTPTPKPKPQIAPPAAPAVKASIIKPKLEACVLPKNFGRGIEGRGNNQCSEGGVLAPGKICDIGCEDKYQYVSGRNIYQCGDDGILKKNNLKCRKDIKPQVIERREDITFICEPKFTELIGLLKKHKVTRRPSHHSYKPAHGSHHIPKVRIGRNNFPGNTGANATPYNSLMDLE